MKVKELIKRLQGCNQECEVDILVRTNMGDSTLMSWRVVKDVKPGQMFQTCTIEVEEPF